MLAGYIYVLVNPAMPGLIKIGRTIRSAEERALELSSVSGVASPFVVAHSEFVGDVEGCERELHAQLADYRYSKNREFFRLSVESAIQSIKKFAGMFPVSSESIGNARTENFLYVAFHREATSKVPHIVRVRSTHLCEADVINRLSKISDFMWVAFHTATPYASEVAAKWNKANSHLPVDGRFPIEFIKRDCRLVIYELTEELYRIQLAVHEEKKDAQWRRITNEI
jgi:hypothetical protein